MTHPDHAEADRRLARAFALDAPPPRDPAFTLQVMAQVAQRRLVFEVVRGAGIAALGALFLWALWPVLARVLEPIAPETWQTMGQALAALVAVGWLLALDNGAFRFGRFR